MPIRFPEVPIGTPVQFFQGGDRAHCYSARVVLDCTGGCLVLVVDPPEGGTLSYNRNVRHISDDHLNRSPEHKRRFGAWDWNPLLKPAVCGFHEVPDTAAAPPDPQPDDAAVQDKIRALHDKGIAPAEIAKTLRAKGWNADRVETYLKQFALNS